jgi:hypothetical protein
MTDPGAVFCLIKVQGEDVSDLVVDLVIEESDERADRARILLGDSGLVLCDVIHEGLQVEIDLGRGAEHAVVFRGVVTSVTAAFPISGSPTLELIAHDSLIMLSLEPRTKRWGNATLSAIVTQIARENELVPGTIAPGDDGLIPEERPAQQVAETDLAFLQRLCRDHDAKLYVDHSQPADTLNVVATRTLLAADPLPGSLQLNGTLYDFRASFDSWAAAPEQALVATDPDTGDVVTIEQQLAGTGDAGWTPDATRIARLGAGAARVQSLMTRSAATRSRITDFWRRPPRRAGAPARPAAQRAGVHGDRLRCRGQVARGRTGGNIWIRPRARVEIVGYGGRWSGVWYLAQVRHHLDQVRRSYETTFVGTR